MVNGGLLEESLVICRFSGGWSTVTACGCATVGFISRLPGLDPK